MKICETKVPFSFCEKVFSPSVSQGNIWDNCHIANLSFVSSITSHKRPMCGFLAMLLETEVPKKNMKLAIYAQCANFCHQLRNSDQNQTQERQNQVTGEQNLLVFHPNPRKWISLFPTTGPETSGGRQCDPHCLLELSSFLLCAPIPQQDQHIQCSS